jgi:hypothetical protein
MFAEDEAAPVEYEGDAALPVIQLPDHDEGIHIRILDQATQAGSRYILAQDATLKDLIEVHCKRERIDAANYRFEYQGDDVKEDTRTMAEVKPEEDAIIEVSVEDSNS